MMIEQDWERLARYVSGESSPAEQAEVERWAASSPENQAMVASIQRRWEAASVPSGDFVDAAWTRLASKLATAPVGRDEDNVIPLVPRRARWNTAARLVPLAAAVLLVAGVVTVWRGRAGTGAESLGTPVAAASETRTGVGERRTVDLPDGSHVAIGAATVLRLGENFAQGERRVYLNGQAVFRVQHDSARPFIVHAAGTVSEDLGTEFDVRAYDGDSVVRVAVSEGVVAFRRENVAADTAVTLRPGDVARIASGAAPSVLHDQNVARLMAWQSGEIVFDDTPLSEVAKELERWYDIECRIDDPSIEKLRVTGNYRLPIDELMRVIGLSVDVKAERRGRVVTFSRNAVRRAFEAPAPATRRVEAGG